MDNDGNYKELVYTPGNGVRICYKDYFSSIIVDGKEMINDPSEPLVVDTLIDPVVKVKFKKGITSLLNCFQRCRSLTSIPGDLFSDNPEIGSFYQCFQNCTGLTFIPEDLFRYNTKVNSFNGCELTSIPKDLFRYNPEVTEFRYCFSTNNGLTSIPEDLFMYITLKLLVLHTVSMVVVNKKQCLSILMVHLYITDLILENLDIVL